MYATLRAHAQVVHVQALRSRVVVACRWEGISSAGRDRQKLA